MAESCKRVWGNLSKDSEIALALDHHSRRQTLSATDCNIVDTIFSTEFKSTLGEQLKSGDRVARFIHDALRITIEEHQAALNAIEDMYEYSYECGYITATLDHILRMYNHLFPHVITLTTK
mgnify:CR=1 FL=1